MKVAYVRVSTTDQNADRQMDALKKYDIEKWYIEKESDQAPGSLSSESSNAGSPPPRSTCLQPGSLGAQKGRGGGGQPSMDPRAAPYYTVGSARSAPKWLQPVAGPS